MFDRLIETDSAAADLKGRGRYFIVSTIVVGVLFVSAVVFSIYAADISLGINELDAARLLAPVMTEDPIPEPERRAKSASPANEMQTTKIPQRQASIANINEQQNVPDSISTKQNSQMSRPLDGIYEIGLKDTAVAGTPGKFGSSATNGKIGTGSSDPSTERSAEEVTTPKPPPVREKKQVIKSLGVINSKAVDLPKPRYPTAAIALNLSGEVQIQVTIDETGKVISSKALNGHSLFRKAAENAARNAVFTPTTLSKVPVKVTGIIVYRFKRN